MEDWALLDYLGAAAAVVTVVAGLFAALQWGQTFLRWLWRGLNRVKSTIPRETIRAMPVGRNWWHMGSKNGQPAMQISTQWLVTNVSDWVTVITSASMLTGWLQRKHKAILLGQGPLEARTAREVSIDAWVQPPFRKKGQSFRARFQLVDNLGNVHKTPWLTIESDWRPKPEPEPQPPEERLHTITDPLEKKVVAILKDEVNRYKECGRPVGGLGSVQVTYQGRTLKGIGYQGREANSPHRQWLVPNPTSASLHSDNLDALVKIFNSESEAGQQVVVGALLDRIDRGNEYAPIGYFFLFSLFRMRRLPDALRQIKTRLMNDGKYGFDECVRMLSGLLQYEYPSFDDSMLDEVELFIDGLAGPLHDLDTGHRGSRGRARSGFDRVKHSARAWGFAPRRVSYGLSGIRVECDLNCRFADHIGLGQEGACGVWEWLENLSGGAAGWPRTRST